MRGRGWSVFSAKQFSKTHILRHVMTHKIHHNGKLLSVCRNPSCGSELFQQNDILLPQKTASNKRMLLVSHFNASCH
ncbi:DinB family protein [Bacillus atrophaeus]|uniref:DinB family protein n=1 Tax=Bacillus atrophaeus TaxID=1452 RepID=UPI00399D184D